MLPSEEQQVLLRLPEWLAHEAGRAQPGRARSSRTTSSPCSAASRPMAWTTTARAPVVDGALTEGRSVLRWPSRGKGGRPSTLHGCAGGRPPGRGESATSRCWGVPGLARAVAACTPAAGPRGRRCRRASRYVVAARAGKPPTASASAEGAIDAGISSPCRPSAWRSGHATLTTLPKARGPACPWRLVASRSPQLSLTAPWRVRSAAPGVDVHQNRRLLLNGAGHRRARSAADGCVATRVPRRARMDRQPRRRPHRPRPRTRPGQAVPRTAAGSDQWPASVARPRRVTWICAHLAAGTRLDVLAAATGLALLAVALYAVHMPGVPADTRRALLRHGSPREDLTERARWPMVMAVVAVRVPTSFVGAGCLSRPHRREVFR